MKALSLEPMRRMFLTAVCALLGVASASAQSRPQLDAGFHKMYELKFAEARAEFSAFENDHPGDPLGEAALAASYLYEEFDRKGVFTSKFFLDDKKLLGGVEGPVDDASSKSFLDANRRAREMAKQRLKSNPRDPDGLLVLTMANGMEADYDALIAKRQLASLHLIKEADGDAANLLAVVPGAQDAYVALGAANYIIGCLPAYKRAFLWFGGIHGDRLRGMNQLQQAALHGHYLQPFAKVLLALAALREKQPELARSLFEDLHREFPDNPVFTSELANAEQAAHPH